MSRFGTEKCKKQLVGASFQRVALIFIVSLYMSWMFFVKIDGYLTCADGGLSQREAASAKMDAPQKVQKSKETLLISREIRRVLVAGAGLEPTTSGL